MRTSCWKNGGRLTAILALLALGLSPAHSQAPTALGTLPQELARKTKLSEEDVTGLLNALGPAVREQLAAGREVTLPGLGVLRVVRIGAYRDLVNGRPIDIPPRNIVEFIPDAEAQRSANAPNARPAQTVEPFQYNPLPSQTKSPKVPSIRSPSTRSR